MSTDSAPSSSRAAPPDSARQSASWSRRRAAGRRARPVAPRFDSGLEVEHELVDLSDARAAEAAVRAVSERVGGLDAVVTAAGTDRCGRLATCPARTGTV
jgi:NAD(P)-dependent dehydrogenase (short-subunit alcohol dehydrogenase family)